MIMVSEIGSSFVVIILFFMDFFVELISIARNMPRRPGRREVKRL
jgi:hypothetical protein